MDFPLNLTAYKTEIIRNIEINKTASRKFAKWNKYLTNINTYKKDLQIQEFYPCISVEFVIRLIGEIKIETVLNLIIIFM